MRLLSLLCFVTALTAASAAETRPNFLLIAVDDLNHYTTEHLGQNDLFLRKVYRDEATLAAVGRRLTPNLQRLATQSLSFSRAYCASALCGPSRTSLFTGIPPHVSGYYQHAQHFRRLDSLKDALTLPQYLKANGYYTTGLGKVYHKQMVETRDGVRHDWPDLDHSWSRWVERRVGSNADDVGNTEPGRAPATPAEGAPFVLSPYSPPADPLFRFGRSLIPTEQTYDYENARFAATLLRTGRATITDDHGQPANVELPADKPFFLACGLFLPHLPWIVPQEFIDRFPVAEMQIDEALIREVTDDIADLPPGTARRFIGNDFDTLKANGEKLHGPGGMVQAWKAALQAYLASIAFADHNIGQLVDALDHSPYRDNTVVMLWGDHGWHLGDKHRFRKQALWDPANHTEFLWRDPASRPASTGATCDQLVSLQDIFPTVAARAGLPIPAHVFGRDLAPLIANPAAPWENALLQTYIEGNHALRTATHRYIRYGDGGRELYDLRADPFELTNLASRPEHAADVAACDAQLDAMLRRDAAFYRQRSVP